MLELLLTALILTVSIVYIIAHSGIVISVSKFIYKKLNPGKDWMGQLIPKPFSCSVCMSFWVILILCIISSISIPYALGLASLMSLLSILIDRLLLLIIRLIHKIN